MLKILLKTEEFNSSENVEYKQPISIADIQLSFNDKRSKDIISFEDKYFDLIVFNPKFFHNKKLGYYKFHKCKINYIFTNPSYAFIQIIYWQSEKLEGAEERNVIIDFLI